MLSLCWSTWPFEFKPERRYFPSACKQMGPVLTRKSKATALQCSPVFRTHLGNMHSYLMMDWIMEIMAGTLSVTLGSAMGRKQLSASCSWQSSGRNTRRLSSKRTKATVGPPWLRGQDDQLSCLRRHPAKPCPPKLCCRNGLSNHPSQNSTSSLPPCPDQSLNHPGPVLPYPPTISV